MSSNGSLSVGSRSSTDLREQSGLYNAARATGENGAVKDAKVTQLQQQTGRHHLSGGMASTPSPDGPVKRNDSKRRSGGFLLGGALGRKARRVSPGDVRPNRWHNRLQIDGEGEDNISTSSPGSARSSKSQGKAPANSDRLSVNFERSPTHSASRSGSNAARHSWAPSVSTGRGSLTSQTPIPTNNRASLDPNQLIQMALTLSEGRRRAASGVHTPPAMKGNRRVASQGDNTETVTPGSPYANDTVRRRTQLSQEVASDEFGHQENTKPGDTSTDVSAFSWEALPDVSYEFSISCLQRAERAKKYFELSHQYRRLLATLPPLRAESAQQSLSLGREYNPLQYLRNERLRHEHGMRLLSGPDEFENVQQVKAYVDATEQVRSRHRDHEPVDRPALPDIRYFQGDAKTPHVTHSRNSTASSRILWFDSEWTFTPMALLADLVWSEDWRNRGSLEDRFGHRIFPQLNPQSPVSEKTPQSPIDKRSRAGTFEEPRSDVQASPGRGRHKLKFLSIHKLEQETAKFLHWHRGRSLSRGSSRSSVSTFGSIDNLTADGINIGPLARHMQKEMREQGADSYGEPSSAGARWDDLQPSIDRGDSRIGRASIDGPSTYGAQSQRRGRPGQQSAEIRRTRSFTDGLRGTSTRESDLITSSNASIDKRGALSATEPSTTFAQEMANGYPGSIYENEAEIEKMDFAAAELTETRQSSDVDRDRRSLELALPDRHREHALNLNVPGLRRRLTTESTDGASAGKGVNKAISRILKDSMLVGFRGPRKGERATRDTGTPAVDGSDMNDDDDELGLRRTESRGSQSGRTYDRHRYDAPLPTFSFPGRDEATTDRTTTDRTIRPNDNLSRQNSGRPATLDIPRDRKGLREDSSEIHSSSMLNLLSPMKLLRSARSPFTSAAPSAQGSTTSLVNKDRDTNIQVTSRPPTYSLAQRKWSIADGLTRVTTVQKQAVTMRDVERVRTLFLSSGIKACELCRQENSVPRNRLPLLVSAETEVGKKIGEVRKRDEFRMAGKLWHKAIADLHRSSENELQLYRNKILPEMRDRIEKLTHSAGEELTAKLQSTADEADAFSTDLNTQQTLAIREVHENIDRLLRRRRRNLVLLRRAGFFMLEWVVVLLMWLLWLVFIVFRVVKVTLFGTYHVIRWMTSL